MIESYLFRIILLFLGSLLNLPVFLASFVMMISVDFAWMSMAEASLQSMLSLLLPGITTLNLLTYTTMSMKQGGYILMWIVVLLLFMPVFFYLLCLMGLSHLYFDSRRLNRTTSAMMIVYAVVLLYVVIKLLFFALSSNLFIVLLIFGIAFLLLRRTCAPMFLIVGIGILIAVLLL